MIDLHTHSLLSDGALLPSELARRYEVKGYTAVAITDHADPSNIDFVISSITKAAKELNKYWKIKVIPGVELTHIPVELFPRLTNHARKKGAKIVVGHGETQAEPVIAGTNKAAIQAGVNILAHPGLITNQDALLAVKKGIYLELTTRKGHSATNTHVIKIAKQTGAKLVLNNDSHRPDDILLPQELKDFLENLSLSEKEIKEIFENSKNIVKRIFC